MDRRKRFGCVVSALPLALLLQCSGSPVVTSRVVAVERGERVVVGLTQSGSGHTLLLQNASYSPPVDVYSDPASESLLKVLADDEMQRLLDVLGGLGMFDRAGPAAAGAREVLSVRSGDRSWFWSRLPGSTDVEAFGNARAAVMAVYNGTTAYHRANVTSRDFAAERDRVEREGQAALQRAMRGSKRKDPPR